MVVVQFLSKYKSTFIGGLVGAVAGFSYYYFVGCANGTCAISSNPINSTLYGLLMGAVLLHNFKK
jgi:LytS/YehU family sensor histidine kinase